MANPIISLQDIGRDFHYEEALFSALDKVSLDIFSGEMIAIVGASGSGKSTLMNILGCLDVPTRGSYRINGQETSNLAPDELAKLRREQFGFIFQRYHLLSHLSVIENTLIPAIYKGTAPGRRYQQAVDIFKRLGIDSKADALPSQLSGGQQQRASIARALINGGKIILADEPTGALDSSTSRQVMAILRELNDQGHTVVIVTHDMAIAETTDRIIQINDGSVVADTSLAPCKLGQHYSQEKNPPLGLVQSGRGLFERFFNAFQMAARSILSHRLRSALTMLGIIIGITSVITIVALSNGAQQLIGSKLGDLGTNVLQIYPGSGYGDKDAGAIHTLTIEDVNILSKEGYVDSVTPMIRVPLTVHYEHVIADATLLGVGASYFRVNGLAIEKGVTFNLSDEEEMRQVAVIDQNTVEKLFDAEKDPLGEVIWLNSVPVRVVGVLQKNKSLLSNPGLNIYIPYSSTISRVIGNTSHLTNVTVRVADQHSSEVVANAISRLLTSRHGKKDFFIENNQDFIKTITDTVFIITVLISCIALISLVVGGIGVMNIMLVSITERTSEIGIRMAVGARQGDILWQFLIESVLVCLMGGFLGVGLAFIIAFFVGLMSFDIQMIISWEPILVASISCITIGIFFGFLPARNAAKLNPVAALARD